MGGVGGVGGVGGNTVQQYNTTMQYNTMQYNRMQYRIPARHVGRFRRLLHHAPSLGQDLGELQYTTMQYTI